MEVLQFAKMLADESLFDLERMKLKYSEAEFKEFLSLLKETEYVELPLPDFRGGKVVYIDRFARIDSNAAKILCAPRGCGGDDLRAAEEEIYAALQIDNIEVPRESVRAVMSGAAP